MTAGRLVVRRAGGGLVSLPACHLRIRWVPACRMARTFDDSCCATTETEDWHSFDNDPTLADCCARDAEDARRSAALRERLAAVDVSAVRPKLSASVLGTVPPPREETNTEHDDDSLQLTSDEDEGAWGGLELARLREERIRELQDSARRKAALTASGNGQLLEVAEAQLQAKVESYGGFVVVHLCYAGSQVCDAMDEVLDGIAGNSLGTRFLRVPIKGRSTAVAHGWAVRKLPALVCLRDAVIVGKAAVLDFGSAEEVHVEKVLFWLGRLRMLRGVHGEAQGSLASEEAEEQEGVDDKAPCPECGRCYPHEHIRAVYGRASSNSGSDTDGD